MNTSFDGMSKERPESVPISINNPSMRVCINLTDELKNLLKVLPQVLLAVVCGWEPFVA